MRKKFLVKPSLQIRHLSWTLGVVFLSCLVGYFLFETLVGKSLHPLIPNPEAWQSIQTSLRWGFALILFIIMVAVGIENYFLFHQFIGPVYALEKGLRKMAEGDMSAKINIRDTDELTDLITAYESMRSEIQKKLLTQELQLKEIKKHINKEAA